jgi:protein-disulfide isomerase
MIRRMLKKLFIVGSLAAALGCQKGDPALTEKLDRLEAKLDTIARKVDTMGGRGAQRPAPPPRGADPSAVYAVPVGDAPVKGPATAKVTIVEAAEFA